MKFVVFSGTINRGRWADGGIGESGTVNGEHKVKIDRVRPHAADDESSRLDNMLESLLKLCREEGAHECSVIDCEDLVFVDRTDELTGVPDEERSIFWPVPRFPKDSILDAVRQYRKAVVFRLNVEDENSRIGTTKKIYDIASRVESACFYGGFYLAIGLAAGNCKEVFCGEDRKCQALTAGKPCRYVLRSRPSMEACGLDIGVIAAKAGWNEPEPKVFLMGMVLVA